MKSIFFATAYCTLSLFGNIKLSDEEIKSIYTKHVSVNFTNEYKNRYVPLPMRKNNMPWKWEGKDFPRVIAVLEFERFVVENKISSEKALGINGTSDPEWDYLPKKTMIVTHYEENPEAYDLHSLDLKDKDFDFVMLNQTLEHVYDPIHCLQNIYQHMREGGILYLNVPSNTLLHNQPFHYFTGFTPIGLGATVALAGFKILSIGQWGNFEYLEKMHRTLTWPDYRQLKHPGLNNMDYPVITWIFAQK